MAFDPMFQPELDALQSRLSTYQSLKAAQDVEVYSILTAIEPIYDAINLLYAADGTAKIGATKPEQALMSAAMKLNEVRQLLKADSVYGNLSYPGPVKQQTTIHVAPEIDAAIRTLREQIQRMTELADSLSSISLSQLDGLESADLTIFRQKTEDMTREVSALATVMNLYLSMIGEAMARYNSVREEAVQASRHVPE